MTQTDAPSDGLDDHRGIDRDALVQALSSFAHTLAGTYDISDVLHDLTAQVTAVLGVSGAGVSLLRDGALRFATCDTERLSALERIQEDVGEGPCVTAARDSIAVLVPDVGRRSAEWPIYVRQAQMLGIHAVAALPLRSHVSLGSLEVFASAPRDWSAEDVEVARLFADIAAGYLRHASELELQRRTSEQLKQALESRVIIEQAKGIVAANRGITVDNAFQILRKYANDRRAPLRAVAEAVVTLGLQP